MREISDIISELESIAHIEKQAKDRRYEVEAELEAALGIEEQFSGTRTGTIGSKKVTVSRKMYTSIDSDKIMQIAEEKGKKDLLDSAFSVKFSLRKKEFDSLPEEDKIAFSDAITEKPSKVSFKITDIKKKEINKL